MASKQIFIVPRWHGTPEVDWYQWLARMLKEKHPEISVEILTMPEPDKPTISSWLGHLEKHLPPPSENVFLIGHSVGNLAILRYLASLPNGESKYGGVLKVAAWFHLDHPYEQLKQWLAPFEYARARARACKFGIVVSDNDQYTKDFETTKKLFYERLGASTSLIHNGRHFNEKEEPAVLEEAEKFLEL